MLRRLPHPCRQTGRTLKPAVGGWGLVEVLVGLALCGLLSTLAWPSYEAQLQRLRRTDAQVILARLQQDREHARGGALTVALGGEDTPPAVAPPPTTTRSDAGHYLVTTTRLDEPVSGYRIEAVAVGPQAGDRACRHLAIERADGQVRRRSGPDARLDNDGAANRRCWGRG